MGMYTGLRIDCVIKPEFADAIAKMHDVRGRWEEEPQPEGFDDPWQAVAEAHPQVEALQRWLEADRRSFIPFGALAYMPDSWGEGRRDFDRNTRRWQVVCSLKNYDGGIEQFIVEVLPVLAERVDVCFSVYEGLRHYGDGDFPEGGTHHKVVIEPYPDNAPELSGASIPEGCSGLEPMLGGAAI